MKNGFKLGLAAIVASLVLVGCGSDSDTTTDTTTTTTDTTTTATITLEEFVTEKTLSISGDQGTAEATFASDGWYEENYSDGGYCKGSWSLISSTLIETICADEDVVVATAEDTSMWEFVGELKTGMTVIIDNPSEGTMEVTITKIETAVNPDA